RLDELAIPPDAARILADAKADAEVGRIHALWEAEMARRALAPLGLPVLLLKGTAYVAAGLAAGQGRLIGDLDILVPRDRLDEAEAALLGAGWEWVKPDPYDDLYYRRWMHELPPLIHRTRDCMIDVHHTILPLTARVRPDAGALIADSMPLSGGLRVLSPNDMILHAVAHLFADGDLSGGLRNLWDIDRLIGEFGTEGLADRARLHGLTRQLGRTLRLRRALLSPSLSRERLIDQLYAARLTARDGWGRETRKLLRFAFYLRSHLIRMPLTLLLRHLWIKWRRAS
nr:nucleotidyltransferase family protein [Sphingomonadaceae bacterium]